MVKYPHVEDYIELISGWDANSLGATPSIYISGSTSSNLVQLATYDVKFFDNLGFKVSTSQALTDKQAELACKLILKYRRQLWKRGIDVSPVENPEYRLPLVYPDRSRRVWIEDNLFKFRFPYSQDLITEIRTFTKDNAGVGSAIFDKETRLWNLGLTEYNLNWLVALAGKYQATVDPEVQALFDELVEVEATPYKIELCLAENGLTITNAAQSLIDYINENLGGFGDENIMTLVDKSTVLGYTVSAEVQDVVRTELGDALDMYTVRDINVPPDQVAIIVAYAKAVNRFPMFVFNPDMHTLNAGEFANHFDADEIIVTDGHNVHITDKTKVVYTNKLFRLNMPSIPLLVSCRNLMFGGQSLSWLQRAEKVIYYTNTKL